MKLLKDNDIISYLAVRASYGIQETWIAEHRRI